MITQSPWPTARGKSCPRHFLRGIWLFLIARWVRGGEGEGGGIGRQSFALWVG